MATVNFQCGHCRNLMAVGQEFLGQQVRCPHCQQVVVAPPPAPPPAAEMPTIALPNRDEQESIFAPPATSDDLFGGAASSRIEMPPPVFPQMGLDDQTVAAPDVPPTPLPPDQPISTPPAPELSPSASGTEFSPPDAGPFAPLRGNATPAV